MHNLSATHNAHLKTKKKEEKMRRVFRTARRANLIHFVPKVTSEKIHQAQRQHHQSVISLDLQGCFLLPHAGNICSKRVTNNIWKPLNQFVFFIGGVLCV